MYKAPLALPEDLSPLVLVTQAGFQIDDKYFLWEKAITFDWIRLNRRFVSINFENP